QAIAHFGRHPLELRNGRAAKSPSISIGRAGDPIPPQPAVLEPYTPQRTPQQRPAQSHTVRRVSRRQSTDERRQRLRTNEASRRPAVSGGPPPSPPDLPRVRDRIHAPPTRLSRPSGSSILRTERR